MNRLITLLNEHDIDYEIIKHTKQISTAQEGAEYFGIHIGQTAPTLIIKTEKGFCAVIISGDYGRLNFTTLGELLRVEQVKLAKPNEVEKVTGCSVGSVSLINHGLPTILDRQLYRFTYVYGGTGMPQTTLKIQPGELERLNEIIGYLR